MQPLLTVVIPVYNCEKYVERAAMSVLNQPCAEHIELLLVDDGSKDSSGSICDRLGGVKTGNVRVFHKENGGVSSARNLGIDNAAGKYIAFLDSDDCWEPDFFDEELVEKFQSEDSADIYKFQYRQVDAYGRFEKVYKLENRVFLFDKPELNRIAANCAFSLIYRIDYLNELNLRFLPCKMNEDISTAELALCFAEKVETSSKTIHTYWENAESFLHSTDRMIVCAEEAKSYRLEKQFLEAHGVNFEIDRQNLSLIISYLPDLCAKNSFKKVWNFTQSEECALLRSENVKPWKRLQKNYELWKKHPRLFWLRCKLHPGIAYAVKRICYSVPFLRKPANGFFHRFILKWQRIKK